MKNVFSAIGAILIIATALGFLVVGILHHSELLDAHRLHRIVTGQRAYPDNLFGGGK
jgi:hypothetical protein